MTKPCGHVWKEECAGVAGRAVPLSMCSWGISQAEEEERTSLWGGGIQCWLKALFDF